MYFFAGNFGNNCDSGLGNVRAGAGIWAFEGLILGNGGWWFLMRRIMLSIIFITIFLICTNYVSAFDLRPDLSSGTYNIVRAVEIDPNRVWINYGQESIGKINVVEENKLPEINIGDMLEGLTEKIIETTENEIVSKTGMVGITGNIIAETQVVARSFFMGMFAALFIIVTILNIILYIKGRR